MSIFLFQNGVSEGIASTDDVRRVLRLTNEAMASDADLQIALDVVVSWLANKLPDYMTSTGTQVFYDVRPGDVLPVPQPYGTITGITATAYGSATTLVPDTDYYATDGLIVLRRRWRWDALAHHQRTWDKVAVSWENVLDPPEALVEGVAMAAANLWSTSPTLVKGMRSERIGSYSYTLSDKSVDDVLGTRARALLRPFMRKHSVFVT